MLGIGTNFEDSDHRSTRVIDDQSFLGDVFFVHIDPSPCASHIMCCAFFIKFQNINKGSFLYPGTKYGGDNPLTIHIISVALTPNDS